MENNTNENQEKGTYQYVCCPVCGSRSIEFVAEYHKEIAGRIFMLIFLCLAATFAGFYYFNLAKERQILLYCAILFGFIALTILISIWKDESKTHISAICRNCGNIWLLK